MSYPLGTQMNDSLSLGLSYCWLCRLGRKRHSHDTESECQATKNTVCKVSES